MCCQLLCESHTNVTTFQCIPNHGLNYSHIGVALELAVAVREKWSHGSASVMSINISVVSIGRMVEWLLVCCQSSVTVGMSTLARPLFQVNLWSCSVQ